MYVEQVRAAVMASPRTGLAALASALWRSHGAGAIGDDDAQQLAELIEARKVVPIAAKPQPRSLGSRPRSPASMERRRRLVSSGWLPPQIAGQFTMAEAAVLAVIAQECVRGRGCRLTLGHIAALAGCCKSTVRNAVRQAQGLGLLVSEEWRLSAFRSAPNHVRILSPEWLAWLRLTARRGRGNAPNRHVSEGGCKTVERTHTSSLNTEKRDAFKESGGGRIARSGPSRRNTHDRRV